MGTYTLDVDATESDAANGVTHKIGDATFKDGDVGDRCICGGGDITQEIYFFIVYIRIQIDIIDVIYVY